MENSEIPKTGPSDWQPITNKADLAVLGELGAEAAKLASAACCCVTRGIDEKQSVTGKINRDWLMDEIADVEAMIERAKRHFQLDCAKIHERRIRKYDYKSPWFRGLRAAESGRADG